MALDCLVFSPNLSGFLLPVRQQNESQNETVPLSRPLASWCHCTFCAFAGTSEELSLLWDVSRGCAQAASLSWCLCDVEW